MHWKGREDVQYAHVLMHPTKTFIAPDESTGVVNDDLATFVFVKNNPVWLVEAVENVVVDERQNPLIRLP